MFKRKCSQPFTKSNSHLTSHFLDPAVRGSSKMAFSQHPHFSYRRTMNDWVILCHTRRQLRQETFTSELGVRKISIISQIFYKNAFNSTAIERIFRKELGNSNYFCSSNLACKGLSTSLKKVYSIMKSLNVEIHPDKTWLGRVKNGFDFLGFRMSPTTIQPSTESVPRRGSSQTKKVALINEQGASTQRIGQYLRRWLGWSILSCAAWSNASAAPAVDCTATIEQTGLVSLRSESIIGSFSSLVLNPQTDIGLTINALGDFCLTGNAQDNDPTSCDADPVTIVDGVLFFVTEYIATSDEFCEYSVTLSLAGSSAEVIPASTPTPVPIFSPLGLVLMSGGLLWYGRRRKATELVKN